MTKRYSFWYSQVETFKGYFTAENQQEADEMLKLLNTGDISLDDLSGFQSKTKEYELIAEQAEWENN
jgi:hypothetical protein